MKTKVLLVSVSLVLTACGGSLKSQNPEALKSGQSITSIAIEPSQVKAGVMTKINVVAHYDDNSSKSLSGYDFFYDDTDTSSKELDVFNTSGSPNVYGYQVGSNYAIRAVNKSNPSDVVNGTLQILAGDAYRLNMVSGDAQVGLINKSLAQPLVVKVVDKYGNPVSGYIVNWSFSSGSGALSAPSSVSDSNGLASITESLGSSQSVNQVVAQASTAIVGTSSIPFKSTSNYEIGSASKLAFTKQPSSSEKQDAVFSVIPQISVLDKNGSIISAGSYPITLTAYKNSTCSTLATGSLSSASAISSQGVASFAGLSYNAGGAIYLKASAGDLFSDCSQVVNVKPTPGVPSKLAFLQYGQSAVQGKALLVYPRVAVQDSSGNLVSDSDDDISLVAYTDASCSTLASGALAGAAASAVDGVALFSSLSYPNAETVYLKAQDGAISSDCSAPVVVSEDKLAVPAKVKFATYPTSESQNLSFLTQPRVQVLNNSNSVVTAAVPVILSAYSDAACSVAAPGSLSANSLSVDSASGYAQFSGVRYSGSGSLYLKAVAGSVSACSPMITVSPTPANQAIKVAFSVAPSASAVAGQLLDSQPKAQILDSNNNVVSNAAVVNLNFFSDAACSVPVVGKNQVSIAAKAGVAAFSGISFNQASSYYLKVSSGTLLPSCSPAIVVGPSSADHMVAVSGDNQEASINKALPMPVKVKVLDSFENVVPNVSVAFVGVSGGASFNPASANTAADGTAQSSVTLGGLVGAQSFKAVASQLPAGKQEVIFSAQAYPTLQLAALHPSTPVGSTMQLTASGGKAPYTYNMNMGGGSVDASGIFHAPASPQSVIAQVKDQLNNIATVSITVANPQVAITVPVANAYVNIANASSFQMSGTCSENGQNVSLTIGSVSASAACSSNQWSKSVDLSSLSDGQLTVVANLKDAYNNPADPASVSIKKDTLAPAVTQSAVAANFMSNQNQVTFGGSCESGLQVAVSGADSASASCAGGTWSYQSAAQSADGTFNYTFTQTDAAGNSTAVTGSWIRNTSKPAISSFAIVTSGPGLINSITPNVSYGAISGSPFPAQYCVLENDTNSADCSSKWLPIPNGFTGNATLPSTAQYGGPFISAANGSKTLSIWLKNSLGTLSDRVDSNTVTLDTVAPVVAISAPTSSFYVNVANKSSFVANGTCSENGKAVSISLSTTGSNISVTPNCASGAWSLTPQDLSSFADGQIQIQAAQTDAAGNVSATASVFFQKDTVAPAVTQTTLAANFMSNQSQVTFGGSCETGLQVAVSGADSASTSCAGGTWSYQSAAQSADGTFNYTFTQTDAAGNSSAVNASWIRNTSKPTLASIAVSNASPTNQRAFSLVFGATGGSPAPTQYCILENSSDSSSCSWQNFPLPSSFTVSAVDGAKVLTAYVKNSLGTLSDAVSSNSVTLDLTPPAMPSALVNLTTTPNHVNNPTIRVSGAENQATMSIYTDSSCASPSLRGSAVASSSVVNVPVTSVISADGVYVFYAQQVDKAGNASPCSTASVSYTYDNTAPTVAISAPTSATYVNSSNVASYTASGTCSEAGLPVNIAVGSVTANPNCSGTNTWSATLNLSTLLDGPLTMTANHTDAAGNAATQASVTFNKKTSAPVITQTLATTPLTTNGGSVSYGGACDASISTVVITGADNTSIPCSGGSWSYTLSRSSDGTFGLTFKQTDIAGNSASVTTSWIRNTNQPTIASFAVSNASPTKLTTFNLVYGALSGNPAAATYCILENDTNSGDCTSFTALPLPSTFNVSATNNAKVLSLWLKNSLGTLSPRYDSNSVTLDTVAPAPTLATVPAYINVANATAYPMSGTCEGTLPVYINYAGNQVQGPNCASGAWSYNLNTNSPTLVGQGSVQLSVTQVDAANNIGTSAIQTATKDTVAPSTPSSLANVTSSPSQNTSPVVSVSGTEASASVSIYSDSACSIPALKGTATSSGGTVQVTVSPALSVDNTYTFYAKQTDVAGNSSACSSASVSYTLDRVAPAPTLATVPAYINSTNATAYPMSGTCEGTLPVYINYAGNQVQGPNCASGAWSYNLNLNSPHAVADGTVQLSVTQVDAANNVGTSAIQTATKDTTVATPTLAFDTGTSSPSSSTTPSFAISGLETSAIVKLYTGSCGGTLQGQTTAASSSVSLASSALSTDGTYNFYAQQTDAAGNVSSCAGPLSFTLSRLPSSIYFVTQPPSTVPAGVISPALQVGFKDSAGNPMTGVTFPLTASAYLGPFDTTTQLDPASTVTVNAVNGVATFSNLIATKAKSGWQIKMTYSGTGGPLTVLSSSFTVNPGTFTQIWSALGSTVPLINMARGKTYSTAMDAYPEDAYSNILSNVTFNYTVNPSTSGSMSASSVTSGSGTPAVSSFTSNTTLGAVTVTATSGSISYNWNVSVNDYSPTNVAITASETPEYSTYNSTTPPAYSTADIVTVYTTTGAVTTQSLNESIGTNPGSSGSGVALPSASGLSSAIDPSVAGTSITLSVSSTAPTGNGISSGATSCAWDSTSSSGTANASCASTTSVTRSAITNGSAKANVTTTDPIANSTYDKASASMLTKKFVHKFVSSTRGALTTDDGIYGYQVFTYNNQLYWVGNNSNGVEKMFRYCDGISGCGTAGVYQLSNFSGSQTTGDFSYRNWMVVWNNKLYFIPVSGSSGQFYNKLWAYCDGSAAMNCGTRGFYQATNGNWYSNGDFDSAQIMSVISGTTTAMDGIYLQGYKVSGAGASKLMRYCDGSAACGGTSAVFQVADTAGAANDDGSGIASLAGVTPFNGVVFYNSVNSGGVQNLYGWKASTGKQSLIFSNVNRPGVVMNGTLYFVSGGALYAYCDGTFQCGGTLGVTKKTSTTTALSNIAVYNNQLIFAATASSGGVQLFSYCDGNACGAAGVTQISNIGTNFAQAATAYSVYGGNLFFPGYNGSKYEYYKYCDGSTTMNCGKKQISKMTVFNGNGGSFFPYNSTLFSINGGVAYGVRLDASTSTYKVVSICDPSVVTGGVCP